MSKEATPKTPETRDKQKQSDRGRVDGPGKLVPGDRGDGSQTGRGGSPWDALRGHDKKHVRQRKDGTSALDRMEKLVREVDAADAADRRVQHRLIFPHDKASIELHDVKQFLAQLPSKDRADLMDPTRTARFVIESSRVGSTPYNQQLAEQRGRNLEAGLRAAGVLAQIEITPVGESLAARRGEAPDSDNFASRAAVFVGFSDAGSTPDRPPERPVDDVARDVVSYLPDAPEQKGFVAQGKEEVDAFREAKKDTDKVLDPLLKPMDGPAAPEAQAIKYVAGAAKYLGDRALQDIDSSKTLNEVVTIYLPEYSKTIVKLAGGDPSSVQQRPLGGEPGVLRAARDAATDRWKSLPETKREELRRVVQRPNGSRDLGQALQNQARAQMGTSDRAFGRKGLRLP